MDAIRKKMQSLKGETDGLYNTIKKFEDDTAGSNAVYDQCDCDIREFGKKVHGLEIDFDETNDKLQKVTLSLEEKEKSFKEVEADISSLTRRIMLMEEEAKKSETTLADTVTKLALSSKEADGILKKEVERIEPVHPHHSKARPKEAMKKPAPMGYHKKEDLEEKNLIEEDDSEDENLTGKKNLEDRRNRRTILALSKINKRRQS